MKYLVTNANPSILDKPECQQFSPKLYVLHGTYQGMVYDKPEIVWATVMLETLDDLLVFDQLHRTDREFQGFITNYYSVEFMKDRLNIPGYHEQDVLIELLAEVETCFGNLFVYDEYIE